MKKYHITKDGRKIALTDLSDTHLNNIIAFIERKATTGITVLSGGGWSHEDYWFDEDEIVGDEVLKLFGYNAYIAERNRRRQSQSYYYRITTNSNAKYKVYTNVISNLDLSCYHAFAIKLTKWSSWQDCDVKIPLSTVKSIKIVNL